MAELDYNTLYEQMNEPNQTFYDDYFQQNYDPNKTWDKQKLGLTMKTLGDQTTTPDFAAMQKAYAQAQKSKSKGSWFTSADAAMPDQTYGLQTNTMGGMTLNEDGTISYNTQTPPNLGFRSMVDMAADTENFDNQFNTESGIDVANIRDLISKSNMQKMMNAPQTQDIDIDSLRDPFAPFQNSSIPQNFRTRMNNPFFERPTLSNASSPANYFNQGLGGVKGIKEKMGQNWFERMMSGAWGKTKELGSRFKEGAKPVFGLASMIGNATNPLNPDSYNYNPELAGELNYLNTQPNMLVDNATSGLLQYGPDSVLSGKNVMSLLGSNSYNEALNNKVGWFEDRLAKGKTISRANYNKAKAEKKAHQNRIQERLNKENAAAAVNAARQVKMEQAHKGGQNPSAGTFSGHSPGGISQQTSRDARGGMSGWGLARGGRVGYGNGGLATLFTRRG